MKTALGYRLLTDADGTEPGHACRTHLREAAACYDRASLRVRAAVAPICWMCEWLRRERIAALYQETGLHPQRALCSCGGSGWIPQAAPDDVAPCLYHKAPEAR